MTPVEGGGPVLPYWTKLLREEIEGGGNRKYCARNIIASLHVCRSKDSSRFGKKKGYKRVLMPREVSSSASAKDLQDI